MTSEILQNVQTFIGANAQLIEASFHLSSIVSAIIDGSLFRMLGDLRVPKISNFLNLPNIAINQVFQNFARNHPHPIQVSINCISNPRITPRKVIN